MAKGMRGHALGYFGLESGGLDHALDLGFVYVVSPVFVGRRDVRQVLAGKKPLPREFPRRKFGFLFKRSGHENPGVIIVQIAFVERLDLFELRRNSLPDFVRQGHGSRLSALSELDAEHSLVEIEMVNAQVDRLREAQAASIHHLGQELIRSVKL